MRSSATRGRAYHALLAPLVACGNPISNQLLYEDELFLAALPSVERLAPPAQVRVARVGDSALLAGAVTQAATLEDVALVIGGTGEALRGAPPDERSDAVRAWDPLSTALRVDDRSVVFWVRGEVVQPAAADDFDWRVEVAPDRDGPWVEVGAGFHGADAGTFTWQLAAHAALLAPDEEVPERLAVTYADASEARDRSLLVEDDDLEVGGTWEVAGEIGLTWLGPVPLTDADPAPPGAAAVVHVPELGGRGAGVVVTAEGEVPFEVCWDARGDDVWRTGGGAAPWGEASRCAVDPW